MVIYDGGPESRDTIDLAGGFVSSGTPTVLIGDALSEADVTSIASEILLQSTTAALNTSWDEVLSVETQDTCRRVLLLRSADLNAFRLINHAHAMNWVTVYYPGQHDLSDSEAEKYMLTNAEYVIAGSEWTRNDKQAFPARGFKLSPEVQSPQERAENILNLVSASTEKSPVRLAIEGATCG